LAQVLLKGLAEPGPGLVDVQLVQDGSAGEGQAGVAGRLPAPARVPRPKDAQPRGAADPLLGERGGPQPGGRRAPADFRQGLGARLAGADPAVADVGGMPGPGAGPAPQP